MSYQATKAVMHADGLSSTEKLVLLAYAEHANGDGENTRPGVQRIMLYTSLSERTVRKVIQKLRKKNLLIEIRKATQHYPTEYKINMKKLSKMAHKDLSQDENNIPRGAPNAGLDVPGVHLVPPRGAPAAPKPPKNQLINIGEPDDFDMVKGWLEQHIGTLLPMNENEIIAINKLVQLGATETDIQNSVAYFKSKDIVARGADHILNSVTYQIRKRKQANASFVEPTVKEETFAEVWE